MFKNRIWIAAAIVIAAVVVGALMVLQGGTSAVSAQHISPADYMSQYVETSAPHLLVDVRTPDEFATGHIHGAVNISLQTLPDRLNELPRDQMIVIYCRSGNRSGQAVRLLADEGYTQLLDMGAISAWTDQGYSIE